MKKRQAKKITQACFHGQPRNWKFVTIERAFQNRFPQTWHDSMVKFICLGMFMRNVVPLAKAFNQVAKATKDASKRLRLFNQACEEIIAANPGWNLDMSNEELAA